jgi:hypothetical protein
VQTQQCYDANVRADQDTHPDPEPVFVVPAAELDLQTFSIILESPLLARYLVAQDEV